MRAALALLLLLPAALPVAAAQGEFRNGWPSAMAEVSMRAYTDAADGPARIPARIHLHDTSGLPDDGWLLVALTLPDRMVQGRIEVLPAAGMPAARMEGLGRAWIPAGPLRAAGPGLAIDVLVEADAGRAGQFEVGIYVAAFDAGYQPARGEAAYGFTVLMAHGKGWVGHGNDGWLVLPAALALAIPAVLVGTGWLMRRPA